MRKALLMFAAAVLAAGLLGGCTNQGGASGLSVDGAWARPGLTGGSSAVYFVINNQGDADTLLSAASDTAGMAELHISKMDADGTMTMERQDSVPIPAGEEVLFEPGGLHVMLMNLTGDLKPDDKINLTLTFKDAGEYEVTATVREP